MDTPTFTDDRPFAAVESDFETEIKNLALAKHVSSPSLPPQMQGSSPTLAPQIENNAERITSSVARLTANSIQELEGLKIRTPKTARIPKFRSWQGAAGNRERVGRDHYNSRDHRSMEKHGLGNPSKYRSEEH